MNYISSEELVNYKVLPFNLYTEKGEMILSAGEILTPGKLLQLRQLPGLYYDMDVPDLVNKLKRPDLEFQSKIETDNEDKNFIFDIEIGKYKSPINKKSVIEPIMQIRLKAFHDKILKSGLQGKELLEKYEELCLKIKDVVNTKENVHYSSQFKLLGDYDVCHPLNVAIMGGLIAKKLDLSIDKVMNIIMGGLLHDIGKQRIDLDAQTRAELTKKEIDLIKNHTTLGYNILKEEMELPEPVCKIALEHHENNNGTGYPNGLSTDWIIIESQIINVCNYYDNLTSGKTHYEVSSSKDALKVMLEIGVEKFSPEVLYTFVHMYSYNDTTTFNDMVL